MHASPLSDPTIQRLAWTLIHFLWQGLGIALVLVLAVWLGGVRQSSRRYACSLLALIGMCACPVATLVLLPGFEAPTPAARPVEAASVASTPVPRPAEAVVDPGTSAIEPAASPVAPDAAGSLMPDRAIVDSPDASSRPLARRILPWIVAGWFLGVVLLSLRLLLGWLGVLRLRGRAEPAPAWLVERMSPLAERLGVARPLLRIGRHVSEAIAVGFLKPMILLPVAWVTQMPPDMLDAVLAHELAHIRRRDLWVNLLQRLVETLLFYHPAVWWLSRRMRIEREMCCDELVVQVTQDPVRYAETLEHIGRLSLAAARPRLAVSIGGTRTVLLQRIRNILRRRPRPALQAGGLHHWLAAAIPLLLAGLVYQSIHSRGGAAARAGDDPAAGQADIADVAVADMANTPAETQAETQAETPVFAWNRSDKYVPPDFDGYFPKDDAEAAGRLDEFLSRRELAQNRSAEFLDVVRRGLRSTRRHRTIVLSHVGNLFIWNKQPQDPAAIELMYHASASPEPELSHYAMYFGLTVVADRSDNLLRTMMAGYDGYDHEIQERIHWGLKTYGDRARTAERLKNLLDRSADLGEAGTLAAVDAYRKLTGQAPPGAERFAKLGTWVVTFYHRDVTAAGADGAGTLRSLLRGDLQTPDDRVKDFVARIDGDNRAGVVLIAGIGERDRLLQRIQNTPGFSGTAEPFHERYLQSHRVPEFARHLVRPVKNAPPLYTDPRPDEPLAWNSSAGYQPPNFEGFFPVDAAAGARLDDLIHRTDLSDFTDRQVLDMFRLGLRGARTNPNLLFGWLAGALRWPANPYQTEILFQAADPAAPGDMRYAAIYYGLTGRGKSHSNVIRLFHDILVAESESSGSKERETRGRILWSVRFDEGNRQQLAERLAETLNDRHGSFSIQRLAALDEACRELTGQPAAARRAYETRGEFAVIFRLKGVTTLDAMEEEVRRRFVNSGHWVDHAVVMEKQEPQCWGLVQGFVGRDWFAGQARQQADLRIDFAALFAPSEEWTRAIDRIPIKLKQRLAAAPDGAAAGAGAPGEITLAGRVEDADGKPVADAQVKLFRTTRPSDDVPPVLIRATRTDARGVFQFTGPPGDFESAAVWSAVPWTGTDPGLGWGVRAAHRRESPKAPDGTPRENVPIDSPDRFVIRLNRKPGQVRVDDPELKPQAGAKVVVTAVYTRKLSQVERAILLSERRLDIPPGRVANYSERVPVPAELQPRLTSVTNAAGSAMLNGVDPEAIAGLTVETEEYGVQAVSRADTYRGEPEVYRVRLNPVGRIEGTILVDARAAAAGFRAEGLNLVFRTIRQPRLRLEDESALYAATEGRGRCVVGADGSFSVARIAGGPVELENPLPGESAFALIPPIGLHVRAGQTLKLALPVTRKVPVRGIVRKRGSNEPIAGARIMLTQFLGSGFGSPRAQVVNTDTDGRYQAQLRPGLVEIRLTTGYGDLATVHAWEDRHPRAGIGLQFDVPSSDDMTELPPLELVPTRFRTGTLLDRAGKPVSALWDVVGLPAGSQWPCARGEARDRGEFRLTFPEPYPPTVFVARRSTRSTPGNAIDMRNHELKIISEQPLVLQFTGALRSLPAELHPETAPARTVAQLEQERRERRAANDRAEAAKLVGAWRLTLPAGFTYPVTITQRADGCLRLEGKQQLLLFGTFAFRNKRLELIEPGRPDVDDFVWTWLVDGSLGLVEEQHGHGANYVGAKLDRIAAAGPADGSATGPAFQIPGSAIMQSRERAIAWRSRRGDLRSRRPAGLDDLATPQAIERAVERAMNDLADETRQSAGLAQLRYLGADALDALAAGARSGNPQVAKWCCVTLQHRGAKGVPPLRQAVKSHPAPSVRAAAASSLGQTFQPEAVPPLIAALDDPDSSVRVAALTSIKYPRDPRAIEPLQRHRNIPGIGHVADDAIAHIQQERGYASWPPETLDLWQLCQDAHTLRGEQFGAAEVNRLVQGLKSGNGSIVSSCLLALGDLDATGAVGEILQAPDSQVKYHVLAQIAAPAAIESLIQRLQSPPSQVREVAILGIADGGDRWAAPLLIALLDDSTLKVEAKGRSTDPLTPAGFPPETWPEWHRAHAALYQFFSRHGLPGRVLNLASGDTNDVPEEIARLKVWWPNHGPDFLAGKPVPNPNLTMVMSFR